MRARLAMMMLMSTDIVMLLRRYHIACCRQMLTLLYVARDFDAASYYAAVIFADTIISSLSALS